MSNSNGGLTPLKVRFVGEAPGLILNNGRLSDPLDPWAIRLRELEGVKQSKRTPDDWKAIARCQWEGSLYLDDDAAENPKVVFPADGIRSGLVAGAKIRKQGKNVAPATFIMAPHFELKHGGPKTLDGLYADLSFSRRERIRSRSGTNYVTKPIFRDWSMDVDLLYMPDLVERSVIMQALADMGERVGLGNRRTQMYGAYGRFRVEALN